MTLAGKPRPLALYRRSSLAAILAAIILGGASPAAADPQAETAEAPPTDAAVREAGKHYNRGLTLYREGEHTLAVIEFDRAYELVPDYRVLYNSGQVRIQLGQYTRARRALEQYQHEGGDRVPADRRESLKADLEMVAARTATLRVVTDVAGAEVLVDDEVVGTSPLTEPLMLNTGAHRLTLRKQGYRAATVRQALAGRDDLTVRIEAEAIPEAPRAPLPPAFVSAPPLVIHPEFSRATWRWATWSSTAVLTVGAAIVGGLGIKASSDLETLRLTKDMTRTDLDAQQGSARGLLTAADVLGGLAIASGGLALFLTLTPSGEKSSATPTPRVGLTVTPQFLGIRGTY